MVISQRSIFFKSSVTSLTKPNNTDAQALLPAYFIQFKAGDRFLSIELASREGNDRVFQPNLSTHRKQAFHLVSAGAGYYYIVLPQMQFSATQKTENLSHVLTIENANLDNGSEVVLQTFAATSNQRFQMISDGQGYYYLQAQHSRKVLDSGETKTPRQLSIFQWSLLESDSQKIRLIKA